MGKNRIIRKIFEHFKYKIKKLDRVMMGPITKKNLKILVTENYTNKGNISGVMCLYVFMYCLCVVVQC